MFRLLRGDLWVLCTEKACSVSSESTHNLLRCDGNNEVNSTNLDDALLRFDPLEYTWDLVICVVRGSGHGKVETSTYNKEGRPRALLEAYWRRFGQTAGLPEQYDSDHEEFQRGAWVPYFKEMESQAESPSSVGGALQHPQCAASWRKSITQRRRAPVASYGC
ncbi:hypothetical protein DOTSEDRAFT_42273 [Dothistroma septosporum NZE10]|uniref:Uncharacterized protein n=1 Tax=Dothistroma septosporum (strain NZE10 / CBS 128990) TaxID=675120 RepID=N1PWR5_DOTSN|nr:hypothetical protein DOTSEDRAFT_42273 [Dothistroma septosporum NZE10]